MWSASYHLTEETSRFILSTGQLRSIAYWTVMATVVVALKPPPVPVMVTV